MSTAITSSSVAPPSTEHATTSPARHRLSTLPLRRQRLIGVGVLWLILAVMIAINAWQSRNLLYSEREQRMVTAVDIGISMLQHYHHLAEQGQLSVPDAQDLKQRSQSLNSVVGHFTLVD